MKIIASLFASVVIATNVFAATNLEFSGVWARPTSGATKNSAVYMKIENKGKEDALISAKTDIAPTAELHKTAIVNEVSQMVPVNKVVIPAMNSISLEPGGMHIMLMNVTKDLKAGDKFDLKLQFENEGERIVNVEVK